MPFSYVLFAIALFEFMILLFSLSLRESAQAWMAARLGDHTAYMQGRVTLNPTAHLDPYGSLLFPGMILFGPLLGFNLFGGLPIGWAKPIPVITRNFRKIVRDDNLTTLAGPLANLLLALAAYGGLAGLALFVPGAREMVLATANGSLALGTDSLIQPIALLLYLVIQVNLALAVFHLLPFPPLDGSRIVRNLLPYNAVKAYDNLGILSYILMIFLGRRVVAMVVYPLLGLVAWSLAKL